MVNDAYMGKETNRKYPMTGKTYYGCCRNVERIPKIKSVREATDPFSGRKIDKGKCLYRDGW